MSELPFLESCDTGSRRLLPSGSEDQGELVRDTSILGCFHGCKLFGQWSAEAQAHMKRLQQKIFACPEYIGRRCDRSEGTDCGKQLTALRLTPSFGGHKDDEPSDCRCSDAVKTQTGLTDKPSTLISTTHGATWCEYHTDIIKNH